MPNFVTLICCFTRRRRAFYLTIQLKIVERIFELFIIDLNIWLRRCYLLSGFRFDSFFLIRVFMIVYDYEATAGASRQGSQNEFL